LLHFGRGRRGRFSRPIAARFCFPLLGLAFALAAGRAALAQSADSAAPQATPGQAAPEQSAPRSTPQAPSQPNPSPVNSAGALHQLASQIAEPCMIRNTGATVAATASMRAMAVMGIPGVNPTAGATPVETRVCVPYLPLPMIDWYARFLNGPEVKPLTPAEKAWLAAHNLLDPFNLLTIGGEAAISVAANSHSPYGPGIPGWGRYLGVSFTQDLTGEFFGTFLIPSLVHQDPHYHREPQATTRHRILHAALQVLWTQGDNGRGMVNYANLAGFAIDDEIGNLYVPGQRTDATSTASRYAIALATAPIDNYVTEFLPDVARHIHIQVVVIQRVINQVARTENTAQ
jgi:hypothetical protein